VAGTGGIDGSSSVEDVRDALRRQGYALWMEPRRELWLAAVGTEGAVSFHRSADSPDEAARAAWDEFVRRNGGIGES
jgi:hypothetical protein